MRDRNEAAGRIVASFFGLLLLSAPAGAAPALPPDPDNAALLYYQAFLACPEPDAATSERFNRVLAGAEPNESVKRYVSKCKYAVHLAEAAVKIPRCDWGIAYSLGSQLPVGLLTGQRRLAIALSLEARIHASVGDYRTALAQCLLMQRMASHGGQYAMSVEGVAYRTIEYILGKMPPDAQTLAWLKSELASTPLTLANLLQVVETEVEMTLQSARTNDKTLPWLRNELLKQANDSERHRLAEMTDDELIDLARMLCTNFLHKAAQILDGGLPYRQTYAELQSLLKGVEEQAESSPAIFLSLESDLEQTLRHYCLRVRRQAQLNAFQIAIGIYSEAARTGRLPGRLPPNQPLDPLTDQEYDYEITETGFILRSRDSDIPDNAGVNCKFAVGAPNALKQPEPWETPTKITPTGPVGATETPGVAETEPAAGAKPQYKGVNDLEAIAQDSEVPPQVRERARAARDRLRTRTAQGLRTPEPILIRASLCRVTDAGISLNIIGVDQDLDTAGLRIKEASTTPDGQITSLTENYPVFLRTQGPYFEMGTLFPVTIRDHGQRRDDDAWEAFLIDSYDWLSEKCFGGKTDQRRHGLEPPTVWISKPESGKARVFICLYDRQRHESDYVEVEDLLDQKPVSPFIYMQMFQSWLEEHSEQ